MNRLLCILLAAPAALHEGMGLLQVQSWHNLSSDLSRPDLSSNLSRPALSPSLIGTVFFDAGAHEFVADGVPVMGRSKHELVVDEMPLVACLCASGVLAVMLTWCLCARSAQSGSEDTETTASVRSWGDKMPVLEAVGVGVLMITASACLINFNKYLISSGAFPYPLHLILLHTCSGFGFSGMLYAMVPSMFPALASDASLVNWDLFVQKLLPVSISFAGSLLLSNMAYFFLSLPFLQMLKQSNVVLVYAASVLIGLKVLNWRHVAVLAFLVATTMLNIKGELNFALLGFAIQMSAQVFETAKLVLTEILLSSAGIRLDPMSFMLLVMPCCFTVLLVVLAGVEASTSFGWDLGIAVPHFHEVTSAAPVLVLNCALAFVLNIAIAMFIKRTSAVGSIIANLIKDSLVVVTSVALLGDAISRVQIFGLIAQLAGCFVYALMQRFPKEYETHGVVGGTAIALFG